VRAIVPAVFYQLFQRFLDRRKRPPPMMDDIATGGSRSMTVPWAEEANLKDSCMETDRALQDALPEQSLLRSRLQTLES
jgi:hypothetical protein